MKSKALSFICILTLGACLGCGQFMNNLRRDWDDPDVTADGLDHPAGVSQRSLASLVEERDEPESSYREKFPSSSTVSRVEPPNKHLYKKGARATKDDFIDQSQEEGSLWASSGQTNYYFTKNKVRFPGDMITLTLENDLYRDVGAEIKQSLSYREKLRELSIAQDLIRKKFLSSLQVGSSQAAAVGGDVKQGKDSLSTSAAAAERATSGEGQTTQNPNQNLRASSSSSPSVTPGPSPSPTAEIPHREISDEDLEKFEKRIPRANFDDVDIYSALDMKTGENFMGQIIERYPNGNYKVKATKRVPYKRGTSRLVSIVGIVKGNDIKEDTDVVGSDKLYEYRIEITR